MVPQRRLIWLLIVFAFTALPVILALTKAFATAPVVVPADSTGTTTFQGLATLALGAAVVWSVVRLRLKGEVGGAVELPTVAAFQARSQVGLALSEVGSLAAWASPGSTWQTMLPFLAGTIVVNLLFIVPAGLTFFRLLEEQDAAPPD
ncbi:MAG: hypothetical protein KIS66_13520 [Fimbriimonadaceae bacterium]|nr:hypothetical protein [Fimbriimonadaceae bacterium]